MISIATTDLREFIRKSRFVKPNNTLAILGYIKVHCVAGVATLTKTNTAATIIQEVTAEHDEKEITVLLDEQITANLCSFTNASHIKINLKPGTGKRDTGDIEITDGRSKLSFSNEDPENFPKKHDWSDEAETLELGEEVLKAITVASKYISQDSTVTMFSYVHVSERNGKWEVFASLENNMFLKAFDQPLRAMLLSSEACVALSALDSVQHQATESADIFKAGDTIYGFTKGMFGTLGYGPIVEQLTKVGGFEADKASLLRFCEMSMGASPTPSPIVEITEGEKNTLHLSFEDHNFRVSNKEDITVGKFGVIQAFRFNAKNVAPALKALPYDKLRLCPAIMGGKFGGVYAIYSEQDPSYTGIIAGMSN